MGKTYGEWLVRWRYPVLLISVLAVVAAASGIRFLTFKTDYRVFFSSDNPQLRAFEQLQNTYTKSDNVLFVLAPRDGWAAGGVPEGAPPATRGGADAAPADVHTVRSRAELAAALRSHGPGAQRPRIVRLVGRVDLATDGSLHVVDFKTGKSATTAKAASENPQLGLYQLAVRGGALDDVPGAPEHVTLGGAELVHVGDRFATGMPKVRSQPPLDEGWTWVNDLVVDAAHLAAGPQYPARVNGGCGRCAFRYMCPAQAPAPVDQPATSTDGSGAEGEQSAPDADTTARTPAPLDASIPPRPRPPGPDRRPGPHQFQTPCASHPGAPVGR